MEENRFFISGIQQVGIGTMNFRKSWNWLIEMFGAETKILEDDTVAERMLPYTGHQPQKRHACIAMNLQGGGGFEIWQYSERQPQPVAFDVQIADLGIFCAKIHCRDVNAFHQAASQKWKDCGQVHFLPNGKKTFYIKDLYGNYFQVVECDQIYIEKKSLTGGIAGAMVGVSNMESSLKFYKEVLGYDSVVYDVSGKFQDWDFLNGAEQEYRRVLLTTSAPRKGAFAEVLGNSTIELVQALERVPRKIYEGRYWGDPGFIQICFDVTGMRELGGFCASKGFPFTVDSCPNGEQFDMGEASGHFTYIEDPDGTLIEFVETHRIPIVKKLGWYLDMNKRDRTKALPKFVFRMLGLVSKETIKQ